MSKVVRGRDAAVEEFEGYGTLLFAIAYRMTGSANEADDIVQEAYLRYSAAPAGEIRSLKTYLSTIVTRLCLDYLKSARVQREKYICPWLPVPVVTGGSVLVPGEAAEQDESIWLCLFALLETLPPADRAVFLLHGVVDYGSSEI